MDILYKAHLNLNYFNQAEAHSYRGVAYSESPMVAQAYYVMPGRRGPEMQALPLLLRLTDAIAALSFFGRL